MKKLILLVPIILGGCDILPPPRNIRQDKPEVKKDSLVIPQLIKIEIVCKEPELPIKRQPSKPKSNYLNM